MAASFIRIPHSGSSLNRPKRLTEIACSRRREAALLSMPPICFVPRWMQTHMLFRPFERARSFMDVVFRREMCVGG
jgi:hypothetical protein